MATINLGNVKNSVFTSLQVFCSFAISLMFIWAVGYFFCTSFVLYDYDLFLEKYTNKAKTTHKHRKEGWADTHIGRYGINGIYDITGDNRNKVVLWGDSYVEAFQVNDAEKSPQLVTNLMKKGSYKNFMCFGVGMAGDSISDYLLAIHKYEKQINSIKAHYILITGLEDITPDNETEIRGVFKSNPYRIEYDEWGPKVPLLQEKLDAIGLYFTKTILQKIAKKINNLHFSPTTISSNNIEKVNKNTTVEYHKAWSFLLGKLREQTNVPIIIIFAPSIPTYKNGKISVGIPIKNEIKTFSNEAEKNNIIFLDISNEFIVFFEKTGDFPRGFSNSKPGLGHLNVDGHKIIADQIYRSFQEIIQ